MSRLVLDSVNFSALASTHWPHLIGYANGRISSWTPAQINQTRQRGQLLALADVLGTAPREASILDFERGDVTSPAVVHEWARARNQFAGDATVYCSPRSIATVVSGLRGEKCNLFVVDLTDDGEPPFTVPHYPGLPGNVRVIGRQFVFGPRSGGDYDMSVFYADDWHPEQAAPAHLFAARAAAAAELGPYQNATSGAEIINPATGQIAGHRELPEQFTYAEQTGPTLPSGAPSALHVMTLPEPFGATGPCADCPSVTSCATAGECALVAAAPDVATPPPGDQAAVAVDQAAADVAGAAVVASTAPDSVVPADEHRAAEQAATARQLAGESWPSSAAAAYSAALSAERAAEFTAAAAPVPVIHDDSTAAALAAAADRVELDPRGLTWWPAADGGAAAADVPTAAAAAQPPLNHAFIKAVLADLKTVAGMFHEHGWHNTGTELERVLGIVWELGGALEKGGQ